MTSQDGREFIKNLTYYVRTHEKALANGLQRQGAKHTVTSSADTASDARDDHPSSHPEHTRDARSMSSLSLASSISLSTFGLGSNSVTAAKLYVTPNQLYYLLSRFEDLGVTVGPLNVRTEHIHAESASSNYVSFLNHSQKSKGHSIDRDSIHSVSSVRSSISAFTSRLSSLGFGFSSGPSSSKIEKRKAAEIEDLKYLYSCFTKVPVLKVGSDHRMRRITDYEEFPFDTAVPLFVFKNISALEIVDLDFRSVFGWDRLADQLRSLTVKRASIDDLADLLTNIVLDDIDRKRRRSSKAPPSPVGPPSSSSPHSKFAELVRAASTPERPSYDERRYSMGSSAELNGSTSGLYNSKSSPFPRMASNSPSRPATSFYGQHNQGRFHPPHRRSSGSSNASFTQLHTSRGNSSNLLFNGILPSTKWRFLRHLNLSENSLTSISTDSLSPILGTLQSLDLSSNLFSDVPEALASLTSLRALNLSNCLIDSLHSLLKHPLPAITVLNLKGNRLVSITGIEKLLSLERLDLRENKIRDPAEVARLTCMPDFREVHVARNPFTKTHLSYRTTIFNIFRRAPGYSQDLSIDFSKPTYNEKRYLVDRVQEPTYVPLPLLSHDDDNEAAQPASPIVVRPVASAPGGEVEEPPSLQLETPTSTRRKGPKRRMNDMSQTPPTGSPNLRQSVDGSTEGVFATALQTPSSAAKFSTSPKESSRLRHESTPETTQPSTEASFSRSTSVTSHSPPSASNLPKLQTGQWQSKGDPVLQQSSEQYRRRIESLKADFGTGWLSALTNDSRADASMATPRSCKEQDVHSFHSVEPLNSRLPAQQMPMPAAVAGARRLG